MENGLTALYKKLIDRPGVAYAIVVILPWWESPQRL